MRFVEERRELAAALRWAARLGMQEGADNHFSYAVHAPGRALGEVFLVTPYGRLWREVTASALVLCDADGEVIEGEGPVESTAFFIHAPLHLSAPAEHRAVLHTHDAYSTALSCRVEGRLAPTHQNALLLRDRVAYDDDYTGLALDRREGERIAACLGGATLLQLANHGILATGPTVADAFHDLYLYERAARVQLLAEAGGHRLRTPPDDVVRTVGEQAKTELPLMAQRFFDAIVRVLDREEPDYRD